ncbi:hypothetical protein TUM4438_44650 [Shewanella sairae]|uniref:Type I restriction endonuclease subunit M n=1 Tax=Shewanella sairae TaxID=190310 RepID=A0ABQ4PRK6_9GAMM|nr:hypothetical protein [Shewanella sairae]MCL1132270.1 hypothetical protein [Shewanella sairae]GIU52296.1 hypothetical protein TUM4438_44650 [Shewanella sairae]
MSAIKAVQTEKDKQAIAWLGEIYLTQAVQALIKNASYEELGGLFYSHAIGDWGLIPEDDKLSNIEALKNNGRVMSSYLFAGVKIWIITEANRERTTALLPSEY